MGTLKTRELITPDRENTGVEKAGLEKAGPDFTAMEKARPTSMEREMDKYKCIMYR